MNEGLEKPIIVRGRGDLPRAKPTKERLGLPLQRLEDSMQKPE